MQTDSKIYKQKAIFKGYFAEFIEKEKVTENLLTKGGLYCKIDDVANELWRYSSVARATGSYPVGRKFKSHCRYQ